MAIHPTMPPGINANRLTTLPIPEVTIPSPINLIYDKTSPTIPVILKKNIPLSFTTNNTIETTKNIHPNIAPVVNWKREERFKYNIITASSSGKSQQKLLFIPSLNPFSIFPIVSHKAPIFMCITPITSDRTINLTMPSPVSGSITIRFFNHPI
ncbi:MAG: hypothetical protein MOIL_00822 [Candidatus Methanolliviera sp. GoM_oil]|nr:MAG: hypothetical protein MOIL_00822 [Candidatus Methanolliviera sp. GoM_oil]